jgi:hypothetical protein
MLTWNAALYQEVGKLQRLIARFMERHTPTAPPELTEAVHYLEENGLFRSMSYGGGMFWSIRPTYGWEDFLPKLDKLSAAVQRLASDYPEVNSDAARFPWARLVLELETSELGSSTAPWRLPRRVSVTPQSM